MAEREIVRIVLSGSSHSEHETDTELEMKTIKNSGRMRHSNSENRYSFLAAVDRGERVNLTYVRIIYARRMMPLRCMTQYDIIVMDSCMSNTFLAPQLASEAGLCTLNSTLWLSLGKI